jgi:hypothetical protein
LTSTSAVSTDLRANRIVEGTETAPRYSSVDNMTGSVVMRTVRRPSPQSSSPSDETSTSQSYTLPIAPIADLAESSRSGKPPGLVTRPIVFKRRSGMSGTFVALAKWEGAVDEVFSSYFSARLSSGDDLTAEEHAEIPFEEISNTDVPLVHPGARFYWTIGYQVNASGQRSRTSLLRFRRIAGKASDDASSTAEGLTKVEETWLNF